MCNDSLPEYTFKSQQLRQSGLVFNSPVDQKSNTGWKIITSGVSARFWSCTSFCNKFNKKYLVRHMKNVPNFLSEMKTCWVCCRLKYFLSWNDLSVSYCCLCIFCPCRIVVIFLNFRLCEDGQEAKFMVFPCSNWLSSISYSWPDLIFAWEEVCCWKFVEICQKNLFLSLVQEGNLLQY